MSDYIFLLFLFLTWVNPTMKGIFYFMETTKVKKQSNRAIQQQQATYKKKSEISEALNLIKDYVNKSTYKYLSHFLHTNGTGVTQAKVKTICELTQISTGIYSKIVKPEIENTFSQPLIIKLKQAQKKDSIGRKNKGAEYKSLIPLSVLKHLIKAKEFEIQQEEEYFQTALEILESDITGDITGDITSNEPIPCESKAEDAFLVEQNKSFRENLLEKEFNTYNTSPSHETENPQQKAGNVPETRTTENPHSKNKRSPKIDLSIIDSRTMKMLNRYKNFADYSYWNSELKTEMAFWIQRAINKTQADITNLEHQRVIKRALGNVMTNYNNDKPEEQLTKLVYGIVEEELEQVISVEAEIALAGSEISATLEKPKKKRKSTYQSGRMFARTKEEQTKIDKENQAQADKKIDYDPNKWGNKFAMLEAKLKAEQQANNAYLA